MAFLRLAQVVTARRDGTQMFYRASSGHIERLAIEAFSQIGHDVDTDATRASDGRKRRGPRGNSAVR